MTEEEEFEFRARREREMAAKPAAAPAAAPEQSLASKALDAYNNLGAGMIRGAGSIGATLLWPIDKATDLIRGERGPNITGLVTGQQPVSRNEERRQDMDAALRELGADTGSGAFGVGKLAGEVAGTAGAGGAVANLGVRAIPALAKAPALVEAVRTGGMSAGGATGARAVAARAAGGGISGAASAGLVDPEQAAAGGAIGAVLPPALQAAGAAGKVVGKAAAAGVRKVAGEVSPEAAALAARAKQLGIEIPADRLVNSKPLDAIASGLNYVPFSGRADVEARMGEQLNQAASRLMGQNTPNINLAIRKAGQDLGAKFDKVLRNTGVQFDQQLLNDVSTVFNNAERELGSDALKAISSQVDDLVAKGATGVIDGQAAYNIKRTLDRIGNRNGPEAWHALELKKVLMDGLNRSLGPVQAQAFATTRQQYGNMLALEKLAKNGVDGELSIARLANLKNINNQGLQELADIAAQFVKPREGQHGAMQRAVVGLATLGTAGPAGVAAGAGLGRAANRVLDSDAMRNTLLGIQSQPGAARQLLSDPRLQSLFYRSAPVLATGQ